jgi:catechol 2,3-dioxygenase-like lactoylglutathione lyase family enzyme
MLNREIRPSLYSVEIRTANWPQMVNWYRHVLGLKVLVRVVDDGYALIEAGETRLALLQRAEPGDLSPRFSLGFEVADLNRAIQRLEEFGTSYNAPRQHAEGFDEVVTHDPDGNTIRLFIWPK